MASSKKLAILGLGSFAGATLLAGLGSATAAAEVEESAPAPYVTSRQALLVDGQRAAGGRLRRGTRVPGDPQRLDAGIVHAQGEGVHVDTIKAVPGTQIRAVQPRVQRLVRLQPAHRRLVIDPR